VAFIHKELHMNTAINWFEIATTDLQRAQRFYETVLGCSLRREPMGEGEGAVFPYAPGDGVGGALVGGAQAGATGAGGCLVYLNAGASLDAVLARVPSAGGQVALPSQALPPGMGFFAHILDTEGNRVGLHALEA
jgi:uncharacterized protein